MKLLLVSFLIILSIYSLAQDTPTRAELSWLRSQIIPIKTCDMNANDSDLRPFSKLVENVEVVALGEVTHGSSEIYKMKDRIIKYLVEKDGFDVFAIEANMPEAYRLNEYIIEGKGDPKELIRGMYFWTWRTQEMLDLVNWMKSYNDQHRKKIKFTGFDMQFYKVSIDTIKSILSKNHYSYSFDTLKQEMSEKSRHDSLKGVVGWIETKIRVFKNYVDKNDSIATKIDSFKTRQKSYEDIISSLNKTQKKNKPAIETALSNLSLLADRITDSNERSWYTQNIRLLEEYINNSDYEDRDKYMAENFLWIKDHNPGSRFIIWAHNGHIQSGNGSIYRFKPMGSYISHKLKENYLVIGFSFHKGIYRAYGKNGNTGYVAQASYPGTYEYYFHETGVPYFLLDLKKITASNSINSWLYRDLKFRQTGAVQMDEEFAKQNISKSFDALIFIDSSTSSTLLPPK